GGRGERSAERRPRDDQPGPVRRGMDLRARAERCLTSGHVARRGGLSGTGRERVSARSTRWNLVDDVDQARSGEDQMAADVALLEAAARDGTRTLRLYTWAHPTLSLGRFQPDDDVDADACA